MKTFKEYITEKSTADIIKGRSKKWIEFGKKLIDTELADEILDLVNIAYAPIGGHAKMKDINDVLKSKYDYWELIDLDNDNKAEIIIFGKKTKYGIKFAGIGHDGSKDAKRTYIKKKIESHSEFGNGHYTEVSDKIADIMLKAGVPTITGKETIEKILGKTVDYVGKHPKGKEGDGWYSRKIAGHAHYKIMIGHAKGV